MPEQPRQVKDKTARGRDSQIACTLWSGFYHLAELPGHSWGLIPLLHGGMAWECGAEEGLLQPCCLGPLPAADWSGVWDELWGDLVLLLSTNLEGSAEHCCHRARHLSSSRAHLSSRLGVNSWGLLCAPSLCASPPGNTSLEVWVFNNTRIKM